MAAKDPSNSTDFGSLEEVTHKYRILKAQVDAKPCDCFSDTLATLASDKALETPLKESGTQCDARTSPTTPSSYTFKKTAVSSEEFSVEEITTLEKHRLSIWLAKFVVLFMSMILVVVLASVMYVVYSTKTMPETTMLGAIFANLNDILLAVLNAGK